MNRLVRGSLVLVIVTVMVLVAASTAGADVPDEWKSLDVVGLTALAQQFRAQGAAGVDDCKALAAYVAERYATASAAGQVNWDEWLDLASVLGAYYPAATQVAMGNGIRQSLAPDEATIKQMTADKFNNVCEVLLNLRQLAPACSISATWTNATDTWKSWQPKDLFWLATALRGSNASGKPARLKLANHISTKYLVDKAATKSVSCEYWDSFIQCFGRYLSAEVRAQWAGKIRVAFADNLGEMEEREFVNMIWTLRRLGDTEVGAMTVKWMDGTTALQSCEAWDLNKLATVLSNTGEAGKPARLRLIEHITSKYLADEAATKSLPGTYWRSLTKNLVGDLSAEARGQWASKLRAVFDSGLGTFVGSKTGDLIHLSRALGFLGDAEAGPNLAQWAGGTTAWQSWPMHQLRWLARLLSASGDAGKPARLRMIEHISGKYLADNAAARSVSCSRWKWVVRYLGGDLSAEVRAQWAGKIRTAFADNLGKMRGDRFRHLVEAVAPLDAKQAAGMVVAWLNVHKDEGFAETSTNVLVRIASFGRADKAGMAPLMNQLETTWLARNSQEPLKSGESATIVRTWLAMGGKTKAQQWTMRVYESAVGTEQARASADTKSLMQLGDMLLSAGLTGEGKDYPAFAAALAVLARGGKLVADSSPPWRYRHCGAALGTAQTRQILQAELTDGEGNPRLMVANILAWGYRTGGELKTWQAFLDGKIATAGMAGDTKARWLLARAHAESALSARWASLRGKKWLDQALATATSVPLRFEILRELVNGYAAIGRHDTGLQVLDSMAGQFAGTEVAADIETLREEIRTAKTEYIAARVRYKAEHEQRVTEAWKNELQKRLAEAQQRGDQETIMRLQRMLGQQ